MFLLYRIGNAEHTQRSFQKKSKKKIITYRFYKIINNIDVRLIMFGDKCYNKKYIKGIECENNICIVRFPALDAGEFCDYNGCTPRYRSNSKTFDKMKNPVEYEDCMNIIENITGGKANMNIIF